jgi:acetyl esterase/lipase
MGRSEKTEIKEVVAQHEDTSQRRGVIQTQDQTNRNLEFFYYIPKQYKAERMPVLICVPGLNGSGRGFTQGVWARFAEENGFVIVAPSFRFNPEDWKRRRSYQFPSVWSGDALLKILDEVERDADISKDELYLFGHSAGAQVAHRFALWRPDICKAVAFHAPGGVTLPKEWIPVKFLITVGENDTSRRIKAKYFVQRCKELGISIIFKEYPGLGHGLTGSQIDQSLNFFKKTKRPRSKLKPYSDKITIEVNPITNLTIATQDTSTKEDMELII